MNEMIEFCTAILGAICDFLVEPPIFYLFSLICFAVIVGIVRSLLRERSVSVCLLLSLPRLVGLL